jgi:hypothetical protein
MARPNQSVSCCSSVKSVHPSVVNEGDKENWDQAAEIAGMHKILQTLEPSSDGEEPVLTSRWYHNCNEALYCYE